MKCTICKEEFEQPATGKSNICRTCASILIGDIEAEQAASQADIDYEMNKQAYEEAEREARNLEER